MAVRFDANGEYLSEASTLTAFNYNAGYTLMAWYYPVSIHATVNLGTLWITNTAITAYDVIGQWNAGGGSHLYVGSNLEYSGGSALSTSTWYHVALVRSSATSLMGYQNGVQFGSTLGGNVSARAAAQRLYIGNPSGSYYVSSRWAHAKLWRVPLTQNEIQIEMQSVAPLTNLRDVVSWWPLMSDNRRLGMTGYPWTENGTLSNEADPEIALRIAPPRPPIWWIPPINEITPAAASAVATAVNPTVVLGALTIAPTPASAVATAVNPTVVLGALTLAPTTASAAATASNPTVVLDALTLAPTPASTIATAVNPTVVLGALTIAPTTANAAATASNPTVVLDALTIAPAAASAAGTATNPTVALSSLTIAPTAASVTATASNPTVVLDALTIAPAAASAAGTAIAPTVILGALTIAPAAASAAGTAVNPTITIIVIAALVTLTANRSLQLSSVRNFSLTMEDRNI